MHDDDDDDNDDDDDDDDRGGGFQMRKQVSSSSIKYIHEESKTNLVPAATSVSVRLAAATFDRNVVLLSSRCASSRLAFVSATNCRV